MDVVWAFLRQNLVGILSGGFTGTMISVFVNYRLARKRDEAEYLLSQVSTLYGPLAYLVRQNEALFDLSRRIHDVYDREYIKKQFSDDALTQQRLDQDIQKTIDMKNEYIREAVANNDVVKALLDRSFGLADPDDMDLLAEFAEHYTRLKHDEHKKLPYCIETGMGDISFMKPELISRVREKHAAKLLRIRTLKSVDRRWWWPF